MTEAFFETVASQEPPPEGGCVCRPELGENLLAKACAGENKMQLGCAKLSHNRHWQLDCTPVRQAVDIDVDMVK